MSFSDIANTKIGWRKNEVYELLKNFSQKNVRSSLNEIIAIEMNVSVEEAKKLKTIKSSIVKRILLDFE